jgi:lipopolysaccharide biosynthesis protein
MKRVALYAHFDPRDEVKRYVLHALRCLREECDEVHFRSTSALPPGELAKVTPFCQSAALRDNAGLDFAMWRHALDQRGLDGVDELVLMNSSVYGPMRSLRDSFSAMADRDVDVWGMTESMQHVRHLQSYFLVFRKAALEHPAFLAFWRGVLAYRDKAQVIRAYELGLTTWLTEQGLRVGALVPWDEVRRDGGRWRHRQWQVTNPASCMPFQCLARGMPFVKVEVFRDNPGKVPLGRLRWAMADRGYDLSLVEFEAAGAKASA